MVGNIINMATFFPTGTFRLFPAQRNPVAELFGQQAPIPWLPLCLVDIVPHTDGRLLTQTTDRP